MTFQQSIAAGARNIIAIATRASAGRQLLSLAGYSANINPQNLDDRTALAAAQAVLRAFQDTNPPPK